MNHFISLQQGIEMTTRYRENRETILAPGFRDRNLLPLSETFDRAAIDALMAKPGCAKLRVYYSMDADLLLHVILVAVDEKDRDILPVQTAGAAPMAAEENNGDEDSGLVEIGTRCPPDCPPPSDLNP